MSEIEMVERVARAICRDLKLNPDDVVQFANDLGPGRTRCRWVDFSVMARAAIAAMRQPTEAMKIDYHYEDIWHEMIDEALR